MPSNIPNSARAGFVAGYGGKSCPDCGGSLELIEEEGYRVYRCTGPDCQPVRCIECGDVFKPAHSTRSPLRSLLEVEQAMTNRQRLAMVLDTEHAHDTMGDDGAPALDEFQPIDVDPNAVSDLEFRLKVSNRLLAAERMIEKQRQIINRIVTRFAVEGRPLPEDSNAA